MGASKKFVGIRIDIESRSRRDLKRTGVYPYTEDPDFKALVVCYQPIYAFPGGARKMGRVRTLDQTASMTGYEEQSRFRRILTEPRLEKHAFNANFERIALSRWLGNPDGVYLDPINWHCTALRANANGVFGTLDEVARALRAPIKKDAAGRRLINLFSKPDKKSGLFHDLTHRVSGKVLPGCWCGVDHTDDMRAFEAYCANDVMTEAAVAHLLPDPPAEVQAQYEADQRINDRGVRHFGTLSRRAVEQVEVEKNRLMGELAALTGLDNPNSGPQFNRWLEAPEQDYAMESLDKAHREEALADPMIPDHVAEALRLKGSASLSSVTKHKAALNTRCSDGRIRGSLQFYGAHTGREAGRGIQPQNLPRYEAPKEDRLRLIKGTAGVDAPRIAKGTVRASLVPARGHVFVVADYNAIEARVLAWFAGETWAEEEFRGAGKIYEATASTMFGVDKTALVNSLKRCDKCGKSTCEACTLRSKGKVSNLALGYGGGAGALVTMGAAEAGIDCGNYVEMNAAWKAAGMPGRFFEWNPDDHDYPELLRIRDLYRAASPATAGFWKLCAAVWDRAALLGQPMPFGARLNLNMVRDGYHNRLVLPSGRSIWYRRARSIADRDNPERVERRLFYGKGKGAGHAWVDTHGGKLTENITQAGARDVLFDLIMQVEALTSFGWPGRIVLHVHDEIVLEAPEGKAETVLSDVLNLMSSAPAWADGLILKGEGKIMERYGK